MNNVPLTWTIGATLDWTTQFFSRHHITEARLEAELLLSSVLNYPRLELILKREELVEQEKLKVYRALIDERRHRKPVAYLLGEQEFMGLSFKVSQDTLIPRPETEHLVEEAVALIKKGHHGVLVDIGTGSGAIAVSVAALSDAAKIYATDVSLPALNIANENICRHGVAARVIPKHGDLFEALAGERIEKKIDILMSNPPYVSESEEAALEPELRFEPKTALLGGIDGLDYYRRIAAQLPRYLKKGGFGIFEMNAAKSAETQGIFKTAGCAIIKVIKDYAGHERVLVVRS